MSQVNLPLPLEGIRVLDCTHIVAGPFCSMLLGDAGAEVIKVERPGMGDRSRLNRPHLQDKDGSTVSGRFLAINRNKKSLTLEIGHLQGKEVFRRLVEVSDVVLRPVSITYVGLREMLSNGSLYACDGAQWRLYGPLRMPPPRDENGFEFYEIHAAYVL